MTKLTISGSDAGTQCPHCRRPLQDGAAAERCDACGAIHHEECWWDRGGCAADGCPSAVAGAARAAPAGAEALPEPPAPREPEFTWSALQAVSEPSHTNRRLVLGLIVAVLVAGGGAAAYLVTRPAKKAAPIVTRTKPVRTASVATTTPVKTAPVTTAKKAVPPPSDRGVAQRLVKIVEYSQLGRAAVRSGKIELAISNRQRTLDRLAALTGGSPGFRRAQGTFKRAMEASLASDRARAAGADATSSDARATAMKRLFVSQFNPLAKKYGLKSFSADGI